MINGYPLNTAAINSAGGSTDIDPVDPTPIDPPPPLPDPTQPDPSTPAYPGFPPIDAPEGYSLPWTVHISLGGQDVTDFLTETVRVDRSEGAAGMAEFSLFYPVGTPVPLDLHDGPVVIVFTSRGVQQLLFTGWVTRPSWHAASRVMRIIATDRLQQRVEAMSLADIEALTGGLYSPDVFTDEIEDHWRYAQDRLSTRPVSLDCDTHGNMRVTNWQSKKHPDYTFNPGSTVYQSVDVRLAQPTETTNRVELTIKYRYPRLWQASATFGWVHPGTGGFGGMQGFCAWRPDSTELPTIDMYLSAVGSTGLTPVSASWHLLPPSMGDPCGNGQPWINNQSELLILGGSVVARRRWVQQVTEEYTVTLATAAGEPEQSRVVSRSSINASVDFGESWPNSLRPYQYSPSGGAGIGPGTPTTPVTPGDHADEPRRQLAFNTALNKARTEIIEAHRRTQVSWQVPTALIAGVDLVHTLYLDDQNTVAQGKCVQRLDELNIETGSALATLTIAILREASGVADPLSVPARMGADESESAGVMSRSYTLGTQLGGKFTSPEYDDELDGFSGNYDAKQDATLEVFPRRFSATGPEIPDARTDEHVLTAAEKTIRVAFTGDLLEI
ncbi:MAG: hypothetical protein GXZ05_09790 [Gammaproteobacteria bacterium]|nr:hypothetical protein [Gammaproteobacteria bacterium]